MVVERILLHRDDDLGLQSRAIAAIGRGELVALPTETVYGVALRPGDRAAVAAVQGMKGRAESTPFTFHLADRQGLDRLAAPPVPRVERLLQRYWPGPLTIVLSALPEAPVLPGGATDGTVGLRLPAHPFTRGVIAACGGSLWLTSINRSGEPPLCDPEVIARDFGRHLALIVDAGPSPLGNASTVVRATGSKLEVLREGILSAEEVLETAARTVLFVCSGNTCRSPLAEAIARHELASALDVPEGDLPALGIAFRSAGTSTLSGVPASPGSIAVAAESGLDLQAHRSVLLEPELCARASRIYAMTGSHAERIAALVPEVAERTHLLDPEGRDIADPFGGALAEYRVARGQITAAVRARLQEWRELMAS
jgi:protein arginine phosphatase